MTRLDCYNSEKRSSPAFFDADLGVVCVIRWLRVSARIDVNSPTWGGLTAGIPMARTAMTAPTAPPDWAYNDKEINKVFVTLKQRFADTRQATLNATHSEITFDSK